MKRRKVLMILMALVILVGGMGFVVQPAQAAYGYRSWSFSIAYVERDVSVTIQMQNFPDNWPFKVKMRARPSGSWVNLPDFDSGKGNGGRATFAIPASLKGYANLELQLVQNKKNGRTFSYSQNFSNSTYWPGTGGRDYWKPVYYPGYNYYYNIPTIWIVAVQRNSSVTIQTHNFPAGVQFDVFMGPMGTRGHGYYVTSFNSPGGSFQKTFSIPPALYGSYQISIRTQSYWSGYYSYNWFYNNTTW